VLTRVDSQDADIESTTSEIIDQDAALLLVGLVQTIRESGGRGLVDHTEDIETGDGTGVLGGSSLSVIEVGWDSHNSVDNLLSKVRFGDFLHLGQNHGADFLGREGLLLAVNFNLDSGIL
jgi:hypothetical protein